MDRIAQTVYVRSFQEYMQIVVNYSSIIVN
jgi:hypothetical protein